MGGLGNQLFQIAVLLFYAKKSNKKMVFKYEENLTDAFNLPRKTFWDSLFKDQFNVLNNEDFNKIVFHSFYHQERHKYIDLPYDYQYNIMLRNDFQSFEYIDDTIRKQMIDYVYSNADLMHIAYDKYNDIKNYFGCEDNDMVSMHLRRTDFIWLKTFNYNLGLNYYKKALETAGKKYIVVFSDDIQWCKENIDKSLYDYKDIYFVDINNVEIEFILMSMFQHNIIANSTFSLWASFISTYQQPKTIIAPKHWYGTTGPKNHDQIYHKYITHII
jgi:hypothetical protein